MSSVAPDFGELLAVAPSRHAESSRPIHPYFGKVDPALADKLIEVLSKEGDTVLDPFCGSGTVLHEALLSGRNVIGWDSSELAALIAAAKLLGLSESEKAELLDLRSFFGNYLDRDSLFASQIPSDCEVPEIRRVTSVEDWFNSNALKELAFIRSHLITSGKSLSPAANLLARTAFSRVITPASNQSGESTYSKKPKDNSPGRVLRLFVDAVTHVINCSEAFSVERRDVGLPNGRELTNSDSSHHKIDWSGQSAEIVVQDTRDPSHAGTEKADLVVSSPPYLMSWDYGLYHKFRFYWLGIDLDHYEETEIGRHLRRKKDDVERYTDDMTRVFSALTTNLTQDAHIALINAPSVVYGKLVDTNAILRDCGAATGWSLIDCVPTIDIPGPHHGMYASLKSRNATAPGESGKKEHVLIFARS